MNRNRVLSNGVEIPCIGMGTYPLKNANMTNAVISALYSGYGMFDTADNYFNERDLGAALQEAYKETNFQRKDIYIETKISDIFLKRGGNQKSGAFVYTWKNTSEIGYYNVQEIIAEKVKNSLNFIQTEYIDLLLLHWPYPDLFINIWREMEELYLNGKVRAIGVCNFRERHFEKLLAHAEIVPMVNQFEIHPLNSEKKLVSYCQEQNIAVEAYCPLGLMDKRITKSEVLQKISVKHKKSISQIILRWDIQQGIIPIPKSGNVLRLKENISIFDFELTDSDMEKINSENENYKFYIESTFCPGY